MLNQGYQGVSGSIRNQDQGWGYQGSLISGSRVKSGSGQRPAPGSTWLTRILVGFFFFNSACLAMPAGSRSAGQSAGGRKKDEIWDLVKRRRKSDHERRRARSAGCANSVTVLQGAPNIIIGAPWSSWKRQEEGCSALQARPARRRGKTNEQLCRYRAKRCPVDGVLAGG